MLRRQSYVSTSSSPLPREHDHLQTRSIAVTRLTYMYHRLTTMALSEWVARGLVDDVKKEQDVESRARL